MSDNPLAAVTSKAGHLPPVAWVGVVGAGLALGLILRKRTSSSTTPVAVASGPTVAGVVPVDTVGLAQSAANAVTQGAPTTNLEWQNQAITRMVAAGQDPAVTQSAITKFLGGLELTPQEAAIVKMAIAALGPPPEGAPPITTTGTGTSSAAAAPTDIRGLSNGQLLDQGDAAVRAGAGYEPFVEELLRRLTVDHSLSINDQVLNQTGTNTPRPITVMVVPRALQYLQNNGAHF